MAVLLEEAVVDSVEAVYGDVVVGVAVSTMGFAVVEREVEVVVVELPLVDATACVVVVVDWSGCIEGEMCVLIDVAVVRLVAEAVGAVPCLLLSDSCCCCHSVAMFGCSHSGRPVSSAELDCMLEHLLEKNQQNGLV